MLDDMQDMLFSATSRNSAWVESSAILFLKEEKQEESYKKKIKNTRKKNLMTSKLRLHLEEIH